MLLQLLVEHFMSELSKITAKESQVPILELRDLYVYYETKTKPVKAVDGVNIKIFKGDSLGLVGESGCGKSTLGFSILRLLKQNGRIKQGSIILTIEGKRVDLTKIPDNQISQVRGQYVSMIFQAAQDALNPLQTIRDHLYDTLKAHVQNREKFNQRIEELLEELEIPKSRLDDRPFQFSGGMLQRISIALALILDPIVVIADEPTTALDVLVQARILNILKRLKEQYHLTLIFISHDLGVISEISNKVFVMYAGQIVEFGETAKIFKNPSHPYTQGLLGAVPNVKQPKKLNSIPGSPPDLINPPSGCRFHPRCPTAKMICRKEIPSYWKTEDGTEVMCHIFNPEYEYSQELIRDSNGNQ